MKFSLQLADTEMGVGGHIPHPQRRVDILPDLLETVVEIRRHVGRKFGCSGSLSKVQTGGVDQLVDSCGRLCVLASLNVEIAEAVGCLQVQSAVNGRSGCQRDDADKEIFALTQIGAGQGTDVHL